MTPIPQLTRGFPRRYTLFLNFGVVAGQGLVDAAWMEQCYDAAWELCEPIAPPEAPAYPLIRLTTTYPGLAGEWSPVGLRPGEYSEVLFVPALAWRPTGGVTIQPADRNPSLYLPNQSYVVLVPGAPRLCGHEAVHEGVGHTLQTSWPEAMNGHVADPNNVMYPGPMAAAPVWTPAQIAVICANLALIRSGVRLNGPVIDGGRPAWPIAPGPAAL